MDAVVDKKLEQARRELLDLGLRNPLLNYRELKTRGVRIVEEQPHEVFRVLVEEACSATFLPAGESHSDRNDAPIPDTLTTIPEEGMRATEENRGPTRSSTKKLRTPYTADQLQHRLLNTYYTARTAIEEQGVNMLFLALGMLEWYEGESSNELHRAPLILVPVSLSRESVRAGFRLKYTGEDIDTNLSLQRKLKTEYGVDLPSLGEDTKLGRDEYFHDVAQAVAGMRRWRVDRKAIVLGFFSFSKLLMFEDLDPANWPEDQQPSTHPILRSLLYDGFPECSPLIGEEENLDQLIELGDLHHVCDADSSQTTVLLEVKNGRNLVVQGPPGTGKSQTITNLIAEAIADGKTVLFVAEKLAALEVVKRRLDKVGLGDACLELHSHKTNKKQVINELRRTLSLDRHRCEERGQSAKELSQARDRLNQYCQALHTPIGDTGATPYQAYGHLLHVQERLKKVHVPTGDEIERLNCSEAIIECSETTYRELRNPTKELQALVSKIGIPKQHPFWGSLKTAYPPQAQKNVVEKSYHAFKCWEAILDTATQVCGFLGVDVSPNLLVPEELIRAVRNGLALAKYQSKWWRYLSRRYRKARLDVFEESQRAGFPDSIDSLLAAARLVLKALGHSTEDPAKRIRSVLDSQETQAELHDLANKAEVSLDTYRAAVSEAIRAVELDEPTRFGHRGFWSVPFDAQGDLFRTWEKEAACLQDMVAWNHQTSKMREQGLQPVVEIAATWEFAAEHLVDLLDQARYGQLIELALREREELASFTAQTHEHVAQRFRELDRRLVELNRRYLAQKHRESLASYTGAGMGTLRHELQKKRRHWPLRKLVLEAGHAIQAIKPIFLMSPLSVAAYLPPGSVKFDLVIFDEASQVRPADALGAILRAEQAVVVGDSRQLPPTSFFDKLGSSEQEEGEDDLDTGTSDLESILDLFVAQGAPEKMLRWHYRSRHDSLIAVSNDFFYDNKLFVFPAPEYSPSHSLGLVFRHLPDTAYEPRKAVNREEARIVAEAVMEHARTHSDYSLGVASFSLAQARAIQDALEVLRRQDPDHESFFSAHPNEPFFIKNLENVQGDERDVIFISVGYGHTQEGYLSMNFGPLNQEGGERRLNVLITRARRQCVVFSNLRADDIDLGRTNSRGVVALKAFLKYAETRQLDVPQPYQGEAESLFEEDVARRLRDFGFEVHHQIGSAGFRVDLAVVDPERPGRYLLGIECDGATYHSARWARDRDRLRQQVLESLGWCIHRIWSTDWFRDPERELKRVVARIEQAKAAGLAR